MLELDDVRLVVDGWTGSVNHNWGTRHTPAYAFGQVCGFDDAPDTTLEIVTARAAFGPVLLPGVTLFVFRHAGQEFAVRSVRGMLQTHGRYRPFSWTFGARVGDHMIEGEIVTEPSDVIGLTYTDTDGGTKHCYNSAIATCRIQAAGKAFGRTELDGHPPRDVRDPHRHPPRHGAAAGLVPPMSRRKNAPLLGVSRPLCVCSRVKSLTLGEYPVEGVEVEVGALDVNPQLGLRLQIVLMTSGEPNRKVGAVVMP